MAKITIGRLPQATVEYERSQFDTLIRELEQIITQLNFSYEQQTKDITTSEMGKAVLNGIFNLF